MSNPPAAEWYYAVKNYTGTSEEQLTVVAGEPLHLLDDSDNEWWYAISPRTEQAGYVPAIFIETTQSRIARVNALKNKKLLVPSPEDVSTTRTAKHSKKIGFMTDPQIFFFEPDDEENGGAGAGAPPKREEDLYAAHGLLKVYAGIWDLEVTYKAIKVGPHTTTEEVIRTAVAKFMSVKNPAEVINPLSIPQHVLDSYSLYLTYGAEERKIGPDEFPLKEFIKLDMDEEQKKLVKFQLKKSVEIDGVVVRIFSEENLFKTILVTPKTTVGDALASACSKFKSGTPENSSLRMVAGGKEKFLEKQENLYDIMQVNRKEGNGDNQKFFIIRKRLSSESVDPQDQGVLRVYGGQLDLDVAYRALFVDVHTSAEAVVALVLEKYGSRDNPKDYYLTLVISGSHERTLDKNEKPLQVIRNHEKEHPTDHLKISLKKSGTTPTAVQSSIKLFKVPMRIYCDFIQKGGTSSSKPVLISPNMTAASVVFVAIEKFNIKSNLTIQDYFLFLHDEDSGLKRQLLPDELPLLVKNELGKNVSFHLSKKNTTSQPDAFPIRVEGKLVWPGESFKTVVVNKDTTATEAIVQALDKFKFKDVDASMFTLVRLGDNGSQEALDSGSLPFLDNKSENYALKKVATQSEVVISSTKIEEPDTEVGQLGQLGEIDNTAGDVRNLLASVTIINSPEGENIADVDVENLDATFSSLSQKISGILGNYQN